MTSSLAETPIDSVAVTAPEPKNPRLRLRVGEMWIRLDDLIVGLAAQELAAALAVYAISRQQHEREDA